MVAAEVAAPKVCPFCTGEQEVTDYHDARMLRRFISDTAKILPRRRTGVCGKHQRRLATTIKRARMLAICADYGEVGAQMSSQRYHL